MSATHQEGDCMAGSATFQAIGSVDVAQIALNYKRQSSLEVSDPLKLLFLPAI